MKSTKWSWNDFLHLIFTVRVHTTVHGIQCYDIDNGINNLIRVLGKSVLFGFSRPILIQCAEGCLQCILQPIFAIWRYSKPNFEFKEHHNILRKVSAKVFFPHNIVRVDLWKYQCSWQNFHIFMKLRTFCLPSLYSKSPHFDVEPRNWVQRKVAFPENNKGF